ncbi:hypothetical protein P7K49_014142, partial [Saguinus oedipus]
AEEAAAAEASTTSVLRRLAWASIRTAAPWVLAWARAALSLRSRHRLHTSSSSSRRHHRSSNRHRISRRHIHSRISSSNRHRRRTLPSPSLLRDPAPLP